MKRIITSFAFILSTFFVMAEGHMTFKGVEIDGTIQEFTKKITAKGFKNFGIEDGTATLIGTFTGEDVIVVAYSTLKTKKVYRVGVIYQAGSQWSMIYNKYSNLKDMLIKKYGEPSEIVEEVAESYMKGDELHALHMDKLFYQCIFQAEQGLVELRIAHEDIHGDFIIIAYTDAVNGQIAESEMIDEL